MGFSGKRKRGRDDWLGFLGKRERESVTVLLERGRRKKEGKEREMEERESSAAVGRDGLVG